jgi:pyruvate dehydrogenase E2 component (dihydrolipoamide acetyltransferase)
MAVEITMPRLSQTTEEVRLIRWLVGVGDTLIKGQALCEVENDKTTMEVESFAAGTVLELYGEPDSVIDAGTVIALLGEPGERVAAVPEQPAAVDSVGTGTAAEAAVGSALQTPGSLPEGVRATRLVQNIAGKRGIDLSQVLGSGAGGLITKKDLEAFLEVSTARAAAPSVQPSDSVVAADIGMISEHQAALGRHLQAAKSRIPHYYITSRIDCETLLVRRGASRRPNGKKHSLDAYLLHAVARALKRHPRCNAWFRSGQLQLRSEINLGLAVAADQELYVPVIRGVDSKRIETIDRELRVLLEKVHSGGLKPEDSRDGTFTVTNLGMYPVDQFTAIINPPQVAILAFGRISKAPEVDESGVIRVRNLCTVTGSFDHRVVNGAQGAAFLGEVKKTIEEEL